MTVEEFEAAGKGFHPTMVRFKGVALNRPPLSRPGFHPTMVRFKGDRLPALVHPEPAQFPSHYGAI